MPEKYQNFVYAIKANKKFFIAMPQNYAILI